MIKAKSYKAIDMAKFIFAILVVGIHVSPFAGCADFVNFVFVDIIAGLAVPFFFMSSCYFFFSKLVFENGKIKKCSENSTRLKKYYIRLLVLYVLWSAVYLLWQIPEWVRTGWFSVAAFKDYFISFLFSASYYHMWYVLSLLYIIPIMYFMLRFISKKVFAVVMIPLYAVGLFYYTFGSYVPETTSRIWELFDIIFTSVFLIMPFVTLCLFIDKSRLSVKLTGVLLLISYVLFAVESIFVYLYTERTSYSQFFIFIIPTIYFLILLLKNLDIGISDETAGLLRNMSTIIYFIHPMIINLYDIIYLKEHTGNVVCFLVIAVTSVVVGYGISRLAKCKKCAFLKYFI